MKDFKRSEDAEIAISKLSDQELQAYLSKQVNYAILIEMVRFRKKAYEVAIVIFIASSVLASIVLSALFLRCEG